MNLQPYKEILRMTKDAINDALVPVRSMRAKKQAELEMARLDELIATYEAQIHEVCCENEVSFSKLIDKQDAMELAKRKKKQYQEILNQMFPEE